MFQVNTPCTVLLAIVGRNGTPMVIDADAINIIAATPELRQLIPVGSVLTPHIGELRRLLPEWEEGRDDILTAFCDTCGCIHLPQLRRAYGSMVSQATS